MSDLSRGAYRVEFTCALLFAAPIRIGTGERLSIVTDAPLLRDQSERPWIPGSSVRGVLRDWCEREAPLLGINTETIRRLFGATPPRRRRGAALATSGTDRQGRLTVFDLLVDATESDGVRVRDHVAIHPTRGAAKEGGKFDQEVGDLTSGTLRLLYEGDGDQDPELTLLYSAVEAFREGLLPLGGKTGWGFGALTVQSATRIVIDRSSIPAISGYLRERLGGAEASVIRSDVPAPMAGRPRKPEPQEPEAWSWLKLTAQLQFDGPMLVAAPMMPDLLPSAAREADAIYQVGANGQPILAGSALRGVLSSHARRICATLGCSDVHSTLFGSVKRDGGEGQRGLLRVGEGLLLGTPERVDLNHVAIDRVTGFAVDQKLFSSAALASPRFRTEWVVRWRSMSPAEEQAVGLFLLLLRDMSLGLLWVGSRTTRGYGHLAELSGVEGALSRVVQVPDDPGVWRREAVRLLTCQRIADLAGEFNAELAAWRRLVTPAA